MTSHVTPFVVHLQHPSITPEQLYDWVGVSDPDVLILDNPDTFYPELHRRDEFLVLSDWSFQHDALVLTLPHARDVYALLRLVENADVIMTVESQPCYKGRQYA